MTAPKTGVFATVEALQQSGRNVYVAGLSPDGRYMLIVDIDRGHASVAPVGQSNGLGRWECSKSHLDAYSDIYRQRFPLRHS